MNTIQTVKSKINSYLRQIYKNIKTGSYWFLKPKLTDIAVNYLKKNSKDFIDVKKLISQYSLEELKISAEHYFSSITDPTYHLSKPFTKPLESADTLANLSQLLSGMKLTEGMTLLDFGSGSCWTSRIFTQFGLKVISLDVSKSALELGKLVYKKHPIIGEYQEPTFLEYDGVNIPLDTGTIDRIVCFDCFHHVPTQKETLKEFFRILKPGGIIGFNEPGPMHSLTDQSQFEMKSFKVIENNIVIDEIWETAKNIGFKNIEIGISTKLNLKTDIESFNHHINGRSKSVESKIIRSTKENHINKRIFWLTKDGEVTPDSSSSDGLLATINVNFDKKLVAKNEEIVANIYLQNIGKSIWNRSDSKYGPVNLGIHLLDLNGTIIDLDFYRFPLPNQDNKKGIFPEEELSFEIKFKIPNKSGKFILEFDLVSEKVSWFKLKGTNSVKIPFSV